MEREVVRATSQRSLPAWRALQGEQKQHTAKGSRSYHKELSRAILRTMCF